MSDLDKNNARVSLPVDTIKERWGQAVDAGFTPVPNVLLRAQAKIGLSPTDMIVVLNLMLHWWHHDRMPHPRTSAIAKRSGLSARTVQRSLKELEKKGLITRHRGRTEKIEGRFRKQAAHYDLSPLRTRLSDFAQSDQWYRPEVVKNASEGTERRAGSGVQTRDPKQS